MATIFGQARRNASAPSPADMCYMLGHVDQWGLTPLHDSTCIRCGKTMVCE